MKLDELRQPGWEDAADNFRERDKKYGTAESSVPVVVQPQTDDEAWPHQHKTFPSGRNGSVRVDALHQSVQRHPGGGLLCAWGQYHASR